MLLLALAAKTGFALAKGAGSSVSFKLIYTLLIDVTDITYLHHTTSPYTTD
jgi:hypothetical protein